MPDEVANCPQRSHDARPQIPSFSLSSLYEPEVFELLILSEQLAHSAADWDHFSVQRLSKATDSDPKCFEERLDALAKRIRQKWLTEAAKQTSRSFRSPNEHDLPTTPRGKQHDFGYERELCPTALERRCSQFFERPPPGLYSEHVLFSSGQAAMLACLLLAEDSKVDHLGGYFETPRLIDLVRAARAQGGTEYNNTVVGEPAWFDGRYWGITDIPTITSHAPTRVIIDATLSGLHFDITPFLCGLPAQTKIWRLHSALKLFQQGLELADVGIVTVFEPTLEAARSTADSLRNVRALCGLGLRFAEIAALELPAFLNREMTLAYEDAIFAHNARLATVVAQNNRLFEREIHPLAINDKAIAPYCTLRLRQPSESAYERLRLQIREGIAARDILLEQGGSFGFRGHRYEIVQPENAPTFLRVALGRRPGASLEKTIELFGDIAALSTI